MVDEVLEDIVILSKDNYSKLNLKDNHKFWGQNKDGSYFIDDHTDYCINRDNQFIEDNKEMINEIKEILLQPLETRKSYLIRQQLLNKYKN